MTCLDRHQHYLDNREKILAANRVWHAANREKVAVRKRTKKYGISREDYDSLLMSQGGRCAICATDSPGGSHGRFHTDHCHADGRVRGILCHNCNILLGMAGDKPAILQAAIHYLTKDKT